MCWGTDLHINLWSNLYKVTNITVSDISYIASLWRSQLQQPLLHPKSPTHNSAGTAVFVQYTVQTVLCVCACLHVHKTTVLVWPSLFIIHSHKWASEKYSEILLKVRCKAMQVLIFPANLGSVHHCVWYCPFTEILIHGIIIGIYSSFEEWMWLCELECTLSSF